MLGVGELFLVILEAFGILKAALEVQELTGKGQKGARVGSGAVWKPMLVSSWVQHGSNLDLKMNPKMTEEIFQTFL